MTGQGGFVLDAGALIAIERNERRLALLLDAMADHQSVMTVPASALAQVLRHPARQARLMRLMAQDSTDTVSLDREHASLVGLLLAASGTADVVDAHVVVCARQRGQTVITSDPGDLLRLDPTLEVIAL